MKIKTILLVCILVMVTNSMVYANEESNEKIYYSENIVEEGVTEELDNSEIDLYSVTS